MMSVKKYQEVLEFVATKNDDVYANIDFIILKEAEQFSYSRNGFDCEVEIMKEFTNEKLYNFFKIRLENECVTCCENIFETFCFLHELGHLIDDYKNNGIDENSYKEYYEKSFISRDEQFYAYRNVRAEKFADDFAINFINENISQLWKIVDENTSEEEIEFYLE